MVREIKQLRQVMEAGDTVEIANPLDGMVTGKATQRGYSKAVSTSARNLRYVWLNPATGNDVVLPEPGTPCLIVLTDQSWTVAVLLPDGDWETIRNPNTGQQVKRIKAGQVKAWSLVPGAPTGTQLKNRYWREVYKNLKNEEIDMKKNISRLSSLVDAGIRKGRGRRMYEEDDDLENRFDDDFQADVPFEDDIDPTEPIPGEMDVEDFEDFEDEDFEDEDFEDEGEDDTSRVGYFREFDDVSPTAPGQYLVVSDGKFELATWSPEDETFTGDDGVVDVDYWEPLPLLPEDSAEDFGGEDEDFEEEGDIGSEGEGVEEEDFEEEDFEDEDFEEEDEEDEE